MSKILMYSTGVIFNNKQTGGTKRFVELLKYFCDNDGADLCCRDNKESLIENGINTRTYTMEAADTGFLAPEIELAKKNKRIIDEIKKENYDAVISFDVPPTLYLCHKHVENIVLMIRKDLIGYEKTIREKNNLFRSWIKEVILRLCEFYTLKRVSKIITQCEYDKAELIKRHRFLKKEIEKKCSIQINNVNPSWIIEKSNTESVELSQDTCNICFIGDFSNSRKGHDILLPAIQNLQKMKFNVTAHIIGSGKELDKFKEEYSSSNIIFYGREDNPLRILKGCDLVIVPSYADSCPNTVMEALYNEVPVIGSRVGGIPEILNDENALFDPNIGSLTNCCMRILKSKDELNKLKESQIKRKKELTFTWAKKISDIALQKL